MLSEGTNRPGGLALLLVCLVAVLLAGCGSTGSSTSKSDGGSFSNILTPGEKLESDGGRLFVTDGCSACHKIGGSGGIGPSLDSFVARTVTLSDNHKAKVNERFLRESLLDPRETAIKGYAAKPMIEALERHPVSRSEAAALADFIETVGPEAEPE